MTRADDILDLWFGPPASDDVDDAGGGDRAGRSARGDRSSLWFAQDPAFDAEIRARFGDDLARVRERLDAGDPLTDWTATPRGTLALVILLDQFSRNIHRDDAAAYAADHHAQAIVLAGIDRGADRALSALERWFFYMPLMHAEDRALQARSVECFEALAREAPEPHRAMCEGALSYARRHRGVVDRFGRFPHRNALLGRDSTDEERAHLADGKRF